MINVIQHKDEYWITFPFDYNILNLVKNVPGRKWNKEGKYWSIPLNHLGMLISQFKDTPYEDMVSIKSKEDININQEIDKTQDIPDVDLSNVKTYVKKGYHLYGYQLDCLKYAIDRENHGNMSGFLQLDSMGLGKSLQAINIALYNKDRYKFKHCLILCCVNTSKYNWYDEIKEHTNGKYEGYILGTRLHRNGTTYIGSTQDKLNDLKLGRMYGNKNGDKLPYFLILNIEAIRLRVKKSHPMSDELIQYIKNDKLQMIVIDEVHKNVSPSSQQGNQLLRIKKNSGNKVFWLPMTGTPIVNKPTDLFLPLRLVDAHSVNSYYMWNKNYCVYGGYGGHEIIGYKNIKQLKSLLQVNMIRRLKEDVLELPDKIEITEYVENSPYQNKLYKKIENEIWKMKDDILKSFNPLSKMLKLRQINGSPELVDENCLIDKQYLNKNAKLKKLIELLEDIQARDEKVVIFSNWVEPLRTIYKYLSNKYKVCCFTGTMKDGERQHHKKVFMENPEYTILIGTIGALGTTHTLTAANNVIFYDEPWQYSDKSQAEDRVYRVGTTKSVNIYTLITKDTVDERVHNILYSKDTISKYIVDNQIDIYNNPDLFYKLLGREK